MALDYLIKAKVRLCYVSSQDEISKTIQLLFYIAINKYNSTVNHWEEDNIQSIYFYLKAHNLPHGTTAYNVLFDLASKCR